MLNNYFSYQKSSIQFCSDAVFLQFLSFFHTSDILWRTTSRQPSDRRASGGREVAGITEHDSYHYEADTSTKTTHETK